MRMREKQKLLRIAFNQKCDTQHDELNKVSNLQIFACNDRQVFMSIGRLFDEDPRFSGNSGKGMDKKSRRKEQSHK